MIHSPNAIPLTESDIPSIEKNLTSAIEKLILSVSGWRTVFAKSGDENDPTPELAGTHTIIAAAAAAVFGAYLKSKSGKDRPNIILGMDTRPTGSAIADIMMRTFLADNCNIRFAAVSAAPEIMAYAKKLGEKNEADGFVYISASHNPIGHNGLKFGLVDGGVIPGTEAAIMIDAFRTRMKSPSAVKDLVSLVQNCDTKALAEMYDHIDEVKTEALASYLSFTKEVISGYKDTNKQDDFIAVLKKGIAKKPLGIVIDFNGSARTISIDKDFLPSLGIKLHTMNDKPGEIVHRIVPEGESLEPCRLKLEELHKTDPSFIMGYMPDCDGDRGNLVIWDEGAGKARSLEAQEVFALCCVSELAHLVWTKELTYDASGNALNKAAVAINGPTSLRIDRIAEAFDVSVFRAETGEANVVGLARKLREQGYQVRIMGEGAAGGNITYPSAVRDPIDTVFALVKILTVLSDVEHSDQHRKGFFETWCDLAAQSEIFTPDFTLMDVTASLPAFTTTASYSEDGLLKVKTMDHSVLKNRYQEIFLREWEDKKADLTSSYNIASWEAVAFVGMEEKRKLVHFGDAGKGGLKIIFKTEEDHEVACIWMRGSATEPVFRVIADVEGSDKQIEKYFIDWQRKMVMEADTAS
ncbi:MAG: phosphatidylglycerol lysyltransferase [Treponema sp.]|jgi:phosphoglucomutase|nr:phosphatidylglycerol lysyltransferase [Treponema sp.]